jgi:hypothetical protein
MNGVGARSYPRAGVRDVLTGPVSPQVSPQSGRIRAPPARPIA